MLQTHSSHSSHTSVVLDDISFSWPDGSPALNNITATLPTGRTGVTGANGTGKSTLLRLIAGRLAPMSGTLSAPGSVGYLPQHLTLDLNDTVSDLLGIRATAEALHAIEAGSTAPEHFELVGDDWDIEDRGLAALSKAGLGGISLDRSVATLSGGETVLIALIGLRLAEHDVALLDEPTNNLDRDARQFLYDAVAEHQAWAPTLIVVSHDVTLLNLMDHTADLHDGSMTVFGGTYTEYREHLAREQTAAEQALRTAEQTLRTEERQRVEAQTKLARRRRYAKNDFANKRRPKQIMNNRKQEAQVSAGKLRNELDEKVVAAQALVDRTAESVRKEETVRIQLPDPDVPAGKSIADIPTPSGVHHLEGPERIAVSGPNGSGKTCLLEDLVHGRRGSLFTERVGYLPQRSSDLDPDVSAIDTVRAAAPQADPQDVRANLARFLFHKDAVERSVGDLSGGERFRVSLARLLLARPTIQLLILDEPTNNLDLATVNTLVEALSTYRGALVVVSHDDDLLERLGVESRLCP